MKTITYVLLATSMGCQPKKGVLESPGQESLQSQQLVPLEL
jgi:hypothetical protein